MTRLSHRWAGRGGAGTARVAQGPAAALRPGVPGQAAPGSRRWGRAVAGRRGKGAASAKCFTQLLRHREAWAGAWFKGPGGGATGEQLARRGCASSAWGPLLQPAPAAHALPGARRAARTRKSLPAPGGTARLVQPPPARPPARLPSRSIVSCYGIGKYDDAAEVHGGSLFIVQEIVRGGNLLHKVGGGHGGWAGWHQWRGAALRREQGRCRPTAAGGAPRAAAAAAAAVAAAAVAAAAAEAAAAALAGPWRRGRRQSSHCPALLTACAPAIFHPLRRPRPPPHRLPPPTQPPPPPTHPGLQADGVQGQVRVQQ
jgi:hypothetical protein